MDASWLSAGLLATRGGISRKVRRPCDRRLTLRIEPLEERTVFAAGGCYQAPLTMPLAVDAVFAPDTPAEVVRAYEDLPNRVGISAFTFNDTNRWTQTSAGGAILSQGDATIIRWSIVPDGTPVAGYNGEPAAASNLRSFLGGIYGSNTSSTLAQNQPWFSVLQATFDRWSADSGVTYQYEPADDGAALGSATPGLASVRGDVRISGHYIDGPSNVLAYNFYPTVGDMVIDTGDTFFANTTSNSLRLRNTMAHELGHGLGLSHVSPTNGTKLMEAYLNLGFDGPQADDILAVNRGYGDRLEKNGGNNTASAATALGASPFALDTISIDDDSDVDWFQFTVGAGSSLSMTVTPTGSTYISNGVSFNSLAQSNLTLAVFGSGGATLLASANLTGAGQGESIANLALPGAGTYYVRITGSANAAQMYRLSGTVSGAATLAPEISVFEGTTEIADNTGSSAFGNVTQGTPAVKTFTVKNTGTANLSLGSTITLPGGFTLAQPFGTTTIVPGASTTFQVALNTAVAGSFGGSVSFTTNDADEATFNFALSGTVVANTTPPPSGFTDDFNRANGTSLGPNWTERAGNMSISSNALVNSVTGVSVATVNNVSAADVVLTADVNLGSGLANRDTGLVARQSGTGVGSEYWGGLAYSNGRYFAQVWKAIDGSWTQLSSRAVSTGAGQLRFEVIGSSLKLSVNGVLTNSVADTALATGRVGVSANNTGARLDNFSVEPVSGAVLTPPQSAASRPAAVTSGAQAIAFPRSFSPADWAAAVDQWLATWRRDSIRRLF